MQACGLHQQVCSLQLSLGAALTFVSAFLPSSFAMYANALAFSNSIEPVNNRNFRRTMISTLAFATGAIVGWPFSLAVAIPFVFEELFLYGTDKVTSENKTAWMVARWRRMLTCAAVAALLFVSRELMTSCVSDAAGC